MSEYFFFYMELEGWYSLHWFNHTSWVAAVTPIDHPMLCKYSNLSF